MMPVTISMSENTLNETTENCSSTQVGETFPSLFHRPEWERVYSIYGMKTYRLTSDTDGCCDGALPLVLLNSRIFGRQLVSLPWFDVAGVSVPNEAVIQSMINEALELADRLHVPVVQIRQSHVMGLSEHMRCDKVVQRLSLETDPETLWDRLKASVRNQVRKGTKNGLVVERGGAELLDEFYAIYRKNMRDLGSPAHSRRLLSTILDVFRKESQIYVVRLDGDVIGGGFTLTNGDTLEIPWAASLRRFNSLCVNHTLYWTILADACTGGFRTFSFGRSTVGSGPYRFKKQWRPAETPLHWYFLSRNPELARVAAVPPQERFGMATRLWRKLPLWLCELVGPKIMARVA